MRLACGLDNRIVARTLILFVFLLAAVAAAQQPSPPRESNAQKTMRITGDPAIAPLLERWETQFRSKHPNVTFENRLTGPASAMAGLYTGVADIAFAGHELLTSESMAFEWIFHYQALPIEVASGGLDGPSFAPGFFVNAANPLSTLTLEQAKTLLGCKDSGDRSWGELGLQGEWANKPIHVYGYDPESEVGIFLRRKILNNSYKWSCEMKTFGQEGGGNSAEDASSQIVRAVQADRYGIGIASLPYVVGDVRPVSLSKSESGTAVALTAQNIIDGQYPLARPFFAYINRDPKKPADASVAAFLQFVLSNEGQRQVESSGSYLPLNEAVAQEQRRKLD